MDAEAGTSVKADDFGPAIPTAVVLCIKCDGFTDIMPTSESDVCDSA